MADHTHIEWTDATWNIVTGCSVVSPGCTNCYAMKLAGTRLQHHPSRAGLTVATKAGPVWNGQVRFNADWLDQPLRWRRPRRIFVAAHGDLFHDGVTDHQLDQIFAVMALCPQHTFQILTKRAERMRAYFAETWQVPAQAAVRIDAGLVIPAQPARTADRWDIINGTIDCISIDNKLFDQNRFWNAEGALIGRPPPGGPLPNVWLGVSAEDQARADERIPILLDTPAAVRWLSAEPLLGPINLDHVKFFDRATLGGGREAGWESALDGRRFWSDGEMEGHPRLDWVVAGGESGPDARPMHPDWARLIRDQCADAGVPFLFKQWGEWSPSEILTDWAQGSGRPFIAWPDGQIAHGTSAEHGGKGVMLRQRGKKAAGRHLDGALHDGYPEGRS